MQENSEKKRNRKSAHNSARRGLSRRLIALGSLLATAVVLVLSLAGYGYRLQPLTMARPSLEVIIEPGTLPANLAEALGRQGIVVPAWALRLATRLRGDARSIQSGSYQFDHPITLAGLLDKLVRRDPDQQELRIVAGWTMRQLKAAMKRHPTLVHNAQDLTDAQLIAAVAPGVQFLEGWFAPDSYLFPAGTAETDLLRRAYQRQTHLLEQAWSHLQAGGPPLGTPEELLILASIVEKETARADDRARIAAVFCNRLRARMRLQSDPTTIYGLGENFDGNLRRSDLRTDTLWNTYTRAGLPITPIAMPGRAALEATAAPAAISALYFVARGDGTSEFNDEFAEHQRAVERWQKSH